MEMILGDGADQGNERKIRVLYIGGSGRSGSTLIERLLAQVNGHCAVGELRYLWERGVRDDGLCGCGHHFRGCDFWRRVMQAGFGGIDAGVAEGVARVKARVDRIRNIPRLLLGMEGNTFKREYLEYTTRLGSLYAAILKESGATVIIDSSKVPPYAYVLNSMPDIELYILHVVRDSRAVAYSWTRKKEKRISAGEVAHMVRFRPIQSAFVWLVNNTLIGLLGLSSGRYMRVRYEDFVQDPEKYMFNILEFMGELGAPSKTDGEEVIHSVSGNPLRHEHGLIRVVPDLEWMSKMSLMDRLVVDFVTWPLLLKYRYLGSIKSGS